MYINDNSGLPAYTVYFQSPKQEHQLATSHKTLFTLNLLTGRLTLHLTKVNCCTWSNLNYVIVSYSLCCCCALSSHQMKLQQSVLEVQLTPFNILLRAVLSQLQEKDQYSIFAQPVSIKEVSNQLSFNKKNLKLLSVPQKIFLQLRKNSDFRKLKKLKKIETRCTSFLYDS